MSSASRFERPALLAATAVGLYFIAAWLFIGLSRIGYPYELEWMEGASVDHVRRILEGQRLYVAPTLDFVPFIYMPGYFYLSAAVAKVVGLGFLPLRLVSFAASVGTLALLFLWARKETGRWESGALAAGAYAATFRLAGAWFDVGRVDALFLFLLLGSWCVLRFHPTLRGLAAAGALLWLALLVKQTALVAAVPALIWAAWTHRQKSLAFVGTFLALSAASLLALSALHGEWFAYYAFGLPSSHPLESGNYLRFWTDYILPLVVVVAIIAAGWRALPSRGFYAALLTSCVGLSWWSLLHVGGWDNVLMPAYAALAIGFAVSAAKVASPRLRLAAHAGAVLQFLALLYPVSAQIPTAADRSAGDALVEKIRAVQGEVWVPNHGALTAMAGKSPHAHVQTISDVLRGLDGPARLKLRTELETALNENRFAAIVADSTGFGGIPPELLAQNRQVAWTAPTEDFMPVTGAQTKPDTLLVPDP